MAEKLTHDMIDEGLGRAEKVVCTPGDERCLTLPYDVKRTQQTCTPKRALQDRSDRGRRQPQGLGRLAQSAPRRGALAALGGLRRLTPETTLRPWRESDHGNAAGEEGHTARGAPAPVRRPLTPQTC
jgi:hypothetical protein